MAVTQKNEVKKANAMSDRQKLDIPDDLVASIADVRSDGSTTNWTLSLFEKDALRLIGSGSGGADELSTQLTADGVYYGLVRTTEQIDKSTTVKFVFISFLGENLGVMKKAKMSTFHRCV